MRRSLLFVALILTSVPASAQSQAASAGQSPWKQLTIEELLDIDVTTAARRPDSIRHAAAPVQVLTREDLHRAGVRYLAEALRLADAFYVGRFDGRTWVVNTRGLNINGTNKLQVMIDGRTIYSPLFSGIFWDAQDVLIDDVERIEIIRGPGASLWGANAVHGTINVITRRAADTQGTLLTLGSGNEELGIGDLRYGGRTGNGGAYRLSTRSTDTATPRCSSAAAARTIRCGEGRRAAATTGSRRSPPTRPFRATPTSAVSGSSIRPIRRSPAETSSAGGRARVCAAARRSRRSTTSSSGTCRISSARCTRPSTSMRSRRSRSGTCTAWCGAEATARRSTGPKRRRSCSSSRAIGPRISSTCSCRMKSASAGKDGSPPSVRSWSTTPTAAGSCSPPARVRLTKPRATVWGAISRAVRMPTRFDSDIRVTLGQPVVVITGSPAFEPEQLVAYEAGVRTQVASELTFDVSVYHDDYRRLRSQELVPGAPVTLGNTIQGHIDGIEFGATWEPMEMLRFHGATSWLHKSLEPAPESRDISGGEGNDACCLARLQIFADLRDDLRLTGLARYIAALPTPHLAAYAEADVTLQWDVRRGIELSLVGQNLLHDSHPEFTSGQPLLEAYERSFFFTITFRR